MGLNNKEIELLAIRMLKINRNKRIKYHEVDNRVRIVQEIHYYLI